MWRKLLFRERRMWRVLRIIILPIYKNGELCEFCEFCDGELCEFCDGELCELCECCETYVSYVLMSKKQGRREHELMSKKTAAGEEENGLMFLCLKKDGGSYGKYV